LPSQLGFDNLETKKPTQAFTRKEYFEIISENVFKNKTLLIIAISQIGVYCLRFAILDWGPTLLKETKHVSLINAVWVVAIFEAAGVLGTLSSGFVTDRFFGGRAHRTSQVSLALSLTSLIIFLAIPNATMGVYLLLLSFSDVNAAIILELKGLGEFNLRKTSIIKGTNLKLDGLFKLKEGANLTGKSIENKRMFSTADEK
jgi:sugar phosphate permease